MMAQAQVVDQVTLQREGGKNEGRACELCHHWSHTHQLLLTEFLWATATAVEDSLTTSFSSFFFLN